MKAKTKPELFKMEGYHSFLLLLQKSALISFPSVKVAEGPLTVGTCTSVSLRQGRLVRGVNTALTTLFTLPRKTQQLTLKETSLPREKPCSSLDHFAVALNEFFLFSSPCLERALNSSSLYLKLTHQRTKIKMIETGNMLKVHRDGKSLMPW